MANMLTRVSYVGRLLLNPIRYIGLLRYVNRLNIIRFRLYK
jgi:hypothetical protein